MRYDDGFVAYLNGVEVARDMFLGAPAWNSAASDSHADEEAVIFTDFNIAAYIALLRPGNNVLAIQALNAATTSSDFLLSVELATGESAPTGDPSISPNAAAYTGPIALTETTRIKARILDKGQWSALNEAVYEVPAK